MPNRSTRARVDPELTRQLEAVGAEDHPVQAVVYLAEGETMSPDATSEAAKRVIEAATLKVGTEPSRVNVMRHLGTMAVEAPASFVRALIDEPGVASVIANIQPDLDAGIGVPSDQSMSQIPSRDVAIEPGSKDGGSDSQEADSDI
jgi:hypothetical protein